MSDPAPSICIKCKRSFALEVKVDPFLCPECGQGPINLRFLSYIKDRINVGRVENEPRGRLVLRELAQNADDAGAQILVLRFEDSCLYAANDGRPFSTLPRGTSELSDFDRIRTILEPHKDSEMDQTGHFGSGFQTVYTFTNSPEVHSNWWSVRMDPVDQLSRSLGTSGASHLVSPYALSEDEERRGALFCFPWRDDAAAAVTIPSGEQPFSNPEEFPRWNRESRRALYQDLVDYAPHLPLFCRNLRQIRLVWCADGNPGAFQVVRQDETQPRALSVFERTVKTGSPDTSQKWFRWEDRGNAAASRRWSSFQLIFRWQQVPKEFRYLGGIGKSSDNNGDEWLLGKAKDTGQLIITKDRSKFAQGGEFKSNEIELLFPLFEPGNGGESGRAFLYSVIPLASSGPNNFAFSARFLPDNKRLNVAVSGYNDTALQWYKLLLIGTAYLYQRMFPTFVEQTRANPALTEEERQRVILNAIPLVPPHRWMRADVDDTTWARHSWIALLDTVLGSEILRSDSGWISPIDAYWPRAGTGIDQVADRALHVIGTPTFTPAFVGHQVFSAVLSEQLGKRELNSQIMRELAQRFLDGPGKDLKYGSRDREHGNLGKDEIESLMAYYLLGDSSDAGGLTLPIVPGKDAKLRRLSAYPTVPPRFASLASLFPDGMAVHPDFSSRLSGVGKQTRLLDADGVAAKLSEVALSHPEWAEGIPDAALPAISATLLSLAENDFRLTNSHAKLRFIPVRCRGRVTADGPNLVSDSPAKGGIRVFGTVRAEERGERYQRNYIFSPPEERFEWLTPEVERSIRFLAVNGLREADVEKVCDMLLLYSLQESKKPLNFLRHFLSQRHGSSLFFDANLSAFLGVQDPKELDRQKKAFLSALRAYFQDEDVRGEPFLTRDAMKEIPCLYDREGRWWPAGSFVLGMRPELGELGCHELNPVFLDPKVWPEGTLRRLGVADRADAPIIVQTVERLVSTHHPDRRALGNIFVYLTASPQPWGDALRRLKDLAWIPQSGGRLSKPGDVIAPSKRNVALLGKDHPSLFDSSAPEPTWVDFVLHSGAQVATDERYGEIGVRNRPSVETLAGVARDRSARHKPPPEGLFSEIARAADSEGIRRVVSPYWRSGSWFDPNHVICQSDSELAAALGQEYLVIDPDTIEGEYQYLRLIGAKSRPDVADLASAISRLSGDDRSTLETNRDLEFLWRRLEPLLHSDDHAITPRGERPALCPIEGRTFPVTQIVLPAEDGVINPFVTTGRLGSWFVFGGSRPSPYPRALRAFGARSPSELGADDMDGLIRSLNPDEGISEQVGQTVFRLLARVRTLQPEYQFGGVPVWPARVDSKIQLMSAQSIFINDDPLADAFPELPFLSTSEGDNWARLAIELALVQKPPCRSFRDSVVSDLSTPSTSHPDNSVADRFKLIGEALATLSRKTPSAVIEWSRWMSAVRAFRVDELNVELRVGGSRKTREVPCRIVANRAGTSVFLLPAHPDLIDDLAEQIVAECEKQGLAPTGIAELSNLAFPLAARSEKPRIVIRDCIAALLRSDTSEWQHYMHGIAPVEAFLPPLIPTGIEAKKGYSDTRAQLLGMYGCCQICGRRTPATEDPLDTCESVRSVISKRGGRYWGEFDRYDLRTSLFLCPIHHSLFERKLVRFPELNEAVDPETGRPIPETVGEAVKNCRETAAAKGDTGIIVEVFESPNREQPKPDWTPWTMDFREEHRRALFTRLAEWLEEG